MSQSSLLITDAVAVVLLVFVLYFPRYRRRDMVVALLGINVSVLSVTTVLGKSTISAGLGLGLFGVLSIIRLRSNELDQEEVVYYFSALAVGLVCGISIDPAWASPALIGAILAALYVGDHPMLFRRARSQTLTLDSAFTDEGALIERLEQLLGGRVRRIKVRRVNLVNDTTVVDVRYDLITDDTRSTDDSTQAR
ncbi:MAG: DUF4956 domain-containing protein [Actinomycetia bacterium]|nr:DUF4956 domain-containing protein [Actinomycetes bacterium]MCP4957754.1 DUF4956 domain-containing protein [Actinomycetes bacterium]